MWRHFRCGEMLDVEKFLDGTQKQIMYFTLFCCKICFDAICAVLLQSLLLQFTQFCPETYFIPNLRTFSVEKN